MDAPTRRVLARIGLALALGGWCAWVSGFRQSTAPALATWAVSLAAVVLVDLLMWRGRRQRRIALHLAPARERWPRPGRGDRRAALAGVSPWLLFGLVMLAWELLGIDTKPTDPHLTISALAQAFRPLNAVLLLVWILAGVGYGAARARTPVERLPRRFGQPATPLGSGPLIGLVAIESAVRAPALLLPHNRGIGVTFWLAVVLAAVLIDQAARRSRARLATAEEMIRLISTPRTARFLMVAAWVFAGWHLFAH